MELSWELPPFCYFFTADFREFVSLPWLFPFLALSFTFLTCCDFLHLNGEAGKLLLSCEAGGFSLTNEMNATSSVSVERSNDGSGWYTDARWLLC